METQFFCGVFVQGLSLMSAGTIFTLSGCAAEGVVGASVTGGFAGCSTVAAGAGVSLDAGGAGCGVHAMIDAQTEAVSMDMIFMSLPYPLPCKGKVNEVLNQLLPLTLCEARLPNFILFIADLQALPWVGREFNGLAALDGAVQVCGGFTA